MFVLFLKFYTILKFCCEYVKDIKESMKTKKVEVNGEKRDGHFIKPDLAKLHMTLLTSDAYLQTYRSK